MKHLIRKWNLRISYPTEEIYLWDDDVAGAHRIPKYHPAIASAFIFAIMQYLFLPTGGMFGSKTSAHLYEPFARARAFLAEQLSRDQTLIMKHANILHLLNFQVEENPNQVTFTPAKADSINSGIF